VQDDARPELPGRVGLQRVAEKLGQDQDHDQGQEPGLDEQPVDRADGGDPDQRRDDVAVGIPVEPGRAAQQPAKHAVECAHDVQAEQDHGGAADPSDAVADLAFRHAERRQRGDSRRGQQAEEHEKQGEAEHEEHAMGERAKTLAHGLGCRAGLGHLPGDAPAHVAYVGRHQRQHARRDERDNPR